MTDHKAIAERTLPDVRDLEGAIAVLTHAVLDVADAIREGHSIDVDIAEAVATPGGILDTLAKTDIAPGDLLEWAAELPGGKGRGWKHDLLVGLAAIKEATE